MTPSPRHRPQVSLSLMLVLMSILALMSAGIFYASRVGAVQDELALFRGAAAGETGDANRKAHLMFLMFTYTSPLLLAMALGGIMVILRYLERHGSR